MRNLDVSAEADRIWEAEGGGSKLFFIGESNNNSDNAPTPKVVSNLSTVRGLSPEEPSKGGTYYSAAVARYGANHKMGGSKFVHTYAVALASPLPKFEFPVGNARVSLVPFAKSVRGFGISATGNFQPTNQIIDFYVQRVANMAGSSGRITMQPSMVAAPMQSSVSITRMWNRGLTMTWMQSRFTRFMSMPRINWW